MRSSKRRAPVLALAMVAIVAATGAAEVELRELPAVAGISGVEPAVAERLQTARARLLELGPEAPAREVAEAYGALGRLYAAYQLNFAAEACFDNARRLAPEVHDWAYLLGYTLEANGEGSAALAAYREALALAPEDPATLVRAGRLSLAAGAPAEARRYFERALAGAPAAARHGLGQVALAAADFEAAATQLEAALELEPEADAARYQLGLAYRGLGRLEEAREQMAAGGPRQPAFPDPLVESVGKAGSSVALDFMASAFARTRGDHAAAIAALGRVLAADPRHPGARALLADSLTRAGREGEAQTVLREALELDPEDISAAYQLGTLLAAAGELDEGLALLEAAAARAPLAADLHRGFAGALARAGRLAEAEARYRRVLELDPLDVDSRLARAGTLSKLGRPVEAAAELAAVLERRPGDPRALFELAEAETAAGRPQQAIAAYEELSRLGGSAAPPEMPPQAWAMVEYRLGALLLEAGRRAEALPHLEAAARAAPEEIAARLALGRALAALGRFERAAEEMAAVLRLDPRHEEASFGRGLALMLAERYPEAREHLQAALERLPDSLAVKHLLARLLAACPTAAVRDGARAFELAREVLEAQPDLEHAETVAMALAELERFAEAADLQRQVVARATALPARLAAARARLAAYERREAVRAPWLD